MWHNFILLAIVKVTTVCGILKVAYCLYFDILLMLLSLKAKLLGRMVNLFEYIKSRLRWSKIGKRNRHRKL